MSPHRERVVRGTVSSEHLVQLFDDCSSLVETVASYLYEGWRRGDALLVAMRSANWARTSAELEMKGCPVTEAVAIGRLVVFDADTTLTTFMVDGDPDLERFTVNVAPVVRRLCDRWSGLTVYGEMVDILAGEGNFIAAEHLEDFWNELSAQCSFRLLCGYSSSHFGDVRNERHLQRICNQHTRVDADPADVLASWLLSGRRARTAPIPPAPRPGDTG